MFLYDVWNSVCVEGSQDEIVRMRNLCCLQEMQVPTNDAVVDFTELMPDSYRGAPYGTYNRFIHGPHQPGTFSFCFDCGGDEAPVEIFEALANEFPTLKFDVHCISSTDEFMASGSYNYPDGNEFKYEEVPEDYWGESGQFLTIKIERVFRLSR